MRIYIYVSEASEQVLLSIHGNETSIGGQTVRLIGYTELSLTHIEGSHLV